MGDYIFFQVWHTEWGLQDGLYRSHIKVDDIYMLAFHLYFHTAPHVNEKRR